MKRLWPEAILNLILHAIHAMPSGGVLPLRTHVFSDVVRLTVSDTGPGLSQELSDRLFDTRVTTKPVRVSAYLSCA